MEEAQALACAGRPFRDVVQGGRVLSGQGNPHPARQPYTQICTKGQIIVWSLGQIEFPMKDEFYHAYGQNDCVAIYSEIVKISLNNSKMI